MMSATSFQSADSLGAAAAPPQLAQLGQLGQLGPTNSISPMTADGQVHSSCSRLQTRIVNRGDGGSPEGAANVMGVAANGNGNPHHIKRDVINQLHQLMRPSN